LLRTPRGRPGAQHPVGPRLPPAESKAPGPRTGPPTDGPGL